MHKPNILTYEFIPNEVIVQHHKSNHGELRQVDLELKALIKYWVVPVLCHRPGAALCAVSWDAMDLHIHVRVYNIPFGPRAFWFWKILATDDLGKNKICYLKLIISNYTELISYLMRPGFICNLIHLLDRG